MKIPNTLDELLSALGRSEDATLFMVILTAFKILLHRYTGQEDICVGWPNTLARAMICRRVLKVWLIVAKRKDESWDA